MPNFLVAFHFHLPRVVSKENTIHTPFTFAEIFAMRAHLRNSFLNSHIGVLALVLVLRLVTTRRGRCSRTVRLGAIPGDWLVHRR